MATPAEADDSTLKRRARRRLIGAIALALIAVIVLPMVFDAERKPLDADISIQIPNKDALVTKGPGALNAPPPAAPAGIKDGATDAGKAGAASREGQSPAPPADAKAGAAKEARVEAKVEAKGAPKDGKPGDGKSGDGKATDSKAADGKAAEGKAADARSARELAEEKRAAAILNAQNEAAKSAKASAAPASDGGFAVQVGAFAADDKVKEARDKLGAAGIKTYTEKLDTKDGERTRVRAGPFAGREAAEAAREQIRSLGFAGANVVAR